MYKERGIVEIQGTHFRPLFRMYFICQVQEVIFFTIPMFPGGQRSERLLFNTFWAMCQFYHGENKLHFDDHNALLCIKQIRLFGFA